MTRKYTYDVVVVGGGAAGVGAAVGAAKAGSTTAIIEKNPFLGGIGTFSNVSSFAGYYTRGNPPRQVVKGVGETVLEKLEEYGSDISPFVSKSTGNATIRFNSEHLKLALDDILEENKIDIFLHTHAYGAKYDKNIVQYIECSDGEGQFTIAAKSFIDTTGDGNLANLLNAQTMWGEEGKAPQMASMSVRLSNISTNQEILMKDLTSAIIKGKEEGIPYLDKETGMIIQIPGEDYGILTIPSVHLEGIDGKSMGEYEKNLRRQALSYVETFRRHIPYLKDIKIMDTGPAIGIRESRRIVGKEILNHKDVLQCKKREDSVARGGWSPEIHANIKELKYIYLEDDNYFSIPMGILESKDYDNLFFAGRNVSCDSIAHSAIRVMGTGFATGQSAGIMSALKAKDELNIANVQNELEKQDALY